MISTNLVWSCLVALVLVSFLLVVPRRRASSLPLQLHNLAWLFALVLIGSGGVTFEEHGPYAWLVLLAGLAAYCVGCVLALPRRRGPKTQSPSSVDLAILRPTRWRLLMAMYAAGFGIYLFTIQRLYGLTTLVSDPASIRARSGAATYLEAVPLYARLLLFLGPFLVATTGWSTAIQPRLSAPVRAIAIAFLVVSQAALLQRTNLFLGMLWLASLHLISRRANSVPAVRARSGLGHRVRLVGIVGVLALSFVVIGNALGKSGSIVESGASPIVRATGLAPLFTYVGGGTIAFQELMESTDDTDPSRVEAPIIYCACNPQTWGRATFAPFLKLLPLAEPFPEISPFVNVGVPTNVYTWFEQPYRDFRIAGVLAFSLAAGWATTRFLTRSSWSIRGYWLGSLLLSVVPLAPFVLHYNSTIFAVGVFLVVWTTRRRGGAPLARRVPLDGRSLQRRVLARLGQ